LWGSFIRRDERAPLSADETRDDAPELLTVLERKGLLSPVEREHLATLERAFLQNFEGQVDAAIEALGGEARAERFIRQPEPPTLGDPSTAPMIGNPRFARSEDVDYIEPAGRYTHISEHATGGMGRVLLVHDRQMDREVALKELLPESEHQGATEDSPIRRTTAMTSRFLQEGLLTAKLEHPSIVPVYEVGRRENGTLYYTMKLVRGKTFSARIKECKTLEDRLALLPNFIQLCQAIAYAHSRGVIHRDIKPANVMIGDFGETVVLDWGIAKVRTASEEEEQATIQRFREKFVAEHGAEIATEIGQAIGTPGYMSPEQALGYIQKINESSDVFSLGVVLYEILAGQRPFDAGSVPSLLNQTVREDPRPLLAIDTLIPPELASIATRALQKDPRDRYQTAEAMLKDLLNFQTGAIVSSHEYSPREVLLRYYRRNRPWILSGATAAAVLLAGFVFSYYSIWQARDRERAERIRAEAAEQDARDSQALAEEQRDIAQTQRARAEEESWIASLRLMHRALEDGDFATVRAILPTIPEERRGWEWRHAKYQSERETLVLSRPGEPPMGLEFNTARTRALVLYDYWQARVWDVLGRQVLFESEKLPDRLNVGVLLDDGAAVALGYSHGIVTLRTVASGAEAARIRLPGGQPCSALIPLNGDRLLIGTEDGKVLQWNWRTGGEATLVTQLDGRIDALDLHAGRGLAAALHGRSHISAIDTKVSLFSLETGEAIASMPGNISGFSPDGAVLVTHGEGRCAGHDTADGSLRWSTTADTGYVAHAHADPKGNLVVKASGGVMLVLDAATGQQRYLRGDDSLREGAVSTDGRFFIALDENGFVNWFDINTNALIDRAGGHEGVSGRLAALEEGNAATLDSAGSLRFWSPERAIQTIAQTRAATQRHYINGLSGSQQHLAAYGLNGEVWLLDPHSGRLRTVLSSQSMSVPHAPAFSGDASLMAWSVDGFSVATLDLSPGAAPLLYRGTTGLLGTSPEISPDRALIAAGDYHGRLSLWRTGEPEPVATLSCGEDAIRALVFLPDGSLLAGDSTGKLHHAATNPPALIKTVDLGAGDLSALAVAPGKDYLAAGRADGSVLLLRGDTLEVLSTVKPSNSEVNALLFTRDGNRLFVASDAGLTLHLVTEGNQLQNSGLQWEEQGSKIALAGDSEDLWGYYNGMLRVNRTAPPSAQALAASSDFVHHALVTPSRLAELAARLEAVAPGWREQLAGGAPLPEGPLTETLATLGLHPGMTLRPEGAAPLLALLAPGAPCGETAWGGGNRAGQNFTGRVTVVCPESPEIPVELSDEECKQLQAEFLTALQFYGASLNTQLYSRTTEWLGWPPEQDVLDLWLPDMSTSPLKPWLTKLRLSVYDRIAAINDRSFSNLQELIEYLRQHPGEGEAPGNSVRLHIKRGAFSEPVVLLQ
jgi:serine/threonine protein kinase/WD40 repeat protein